MLFLESENNQAILFVGSKTLGTWNLDLLNQTRNVLTFQPMYVVYRMSYFSISIVDVNEFIIHCLIPYSINMACRVAMLQIEKQFLK